MNIIKFWNYLPVTINFSHLPYYIYLSYTLCILVNTYVLERVVDFEHSTMFEHCITKLPLRVGLIYTCFIDEWISDVFMKHILRTEVRNTVLQTQWCIQNTQQNKYLFRIRAAIYLLLWRRDSQWACHVQSEGFFNSHYSRATML